MANTTAIDSVVDPAAEKQFNDLKATSKLLREELVQLLETAIKLNATLGGSTPAQFAKNAEASTIATQKLIDAQNKAAISATKLQSAQVQLAAQQARQQAAQDKATASAQKALSPYQQLSKELDNLRAKAKDVGVQFGLHSEQFKSAAKPVQELDEKLKNIDKTLGQSQRNVGNYKDFFGGFIRQSIPFGESTIRVTENLKSLGIDADEALESVTGLGAGFASAGTAVFVAGVAAATYYLSQFAETSEFVEVKLAGLKAAFSDIGKNLVESVFSKPDTTKSFGDEFLSVLNSVSSPLSASHPKKDDVVERGEKTQRDLQLLEHKKQLEEAANAELQIEAEKNRTLSADHDKDISERRGYLSKAQEIEKEILKSQQESAARTIKVALEVGFLTSSLNAKQIEAQKKSLIYAASIGDLGPAQELALNGTKFTSAGLELYKKGLEERRQALAGANNEELRLQADKNNLELKADRALALAQNALDKARIESVQQSSKTILDNVKSSNTQKLRANNDFINQSIALINLEKKNQLDTAGLGSGRTGKDSRVEAITRQTIEQTAQNKITQVRNQGMQTRQAILKNEYDAEDRLGKARIQGELDVAKLTLDNQMADYKKKTDANEKYIADSLKLLDVENRNNIIAANLPSNPKNDDKTQAKVRLAIAQEFENKKNEIIANGARQRLIIEKKNLEDIITADKDAEQQELDIVNEGAILAAQALNDAKDEAINKKTLAYANSLLTEKEYNRQILAINDEYNIQRIAQELTVQQTILTLRQADKNKALTDAKAAGATPQELDKISSDADKGITPVKNNIGSLNNQLSNAKTKQKVDQIQGKKDDSTEARKALGEALEEAKTITQDINDLIDKSYENQIAKLEKIGQKIQENAEIEKLAIDRSLDTQSNKARRQLVLEAETASAQRAIQESIAQEKTKQARADKLAAIAEIILNTAIAATKVTAQAGLLGLLTGVPAVIALGAIQLAKVVATPIPQFYKGTPAGGHKGGLAIIGELGSERVKEPGKPAYYSPGVATMVNLPRGTVVTPHNMLPVTPKWESTRTDNRDVVDGLSRIERAVSGQPKQRGAKLAGWASEQRQADAWNSYSRNHFK